MTLHPEIRGVDLAEASSKASSNEEAAELLGVSLLSYRMLCEDYSQLTVDRRKELGLQYEPLVPKKYARRKSAVLTKGNLKRVCFYSNSDAQAAKQLGLERRKFQSIAAEWGIERPSDRQKRLDSIRVPKELCIKCLEEQETLQGSC